MDLNLFTSWRKLRKPRKEYTAEATELFMRFAKRHELTHGVTDAAVEVMWEFPVQERLHIPLFLGLQNCDELNFGVPGFRSYFFPFPSVCAQFEAVLDAWVKWTGENRKSRQAEGAPARDASRRQMDSGL